MQLVVSPIRYPVSASGSLVRLRVVKTRIRQPVMLNAAVIALQELRFVRNDITICGMLEKLQIAMEASCTLLRALGGKRFANNSPDMTAA